MIFYSMKRDFSHKNHLSTNHYLVRPPSQPAVPEVTARYIYCNTVADYVGIGRELEAQGMASILVRLSEDSIRQWPGFPKELGTSNAGEFERNLYVSGMTSGDGRILEMPRVNLRKQLRRLGSSNLRIAVINGAGAGVGDTVVGLTALRNAYELLSSGGRRISLDMVVPESTCDRVHELYEAVGFIDQVRTLPITLHELCRYDACFDTGGLAHRLDFTRLPMVDFFLKVFGVDFRGVLPVRKRNRLAQAGGPAPDLAEKLQELGQQGRRLLLFHPLASTPLRSIPDSEIPRMLEALVSDGRYQVVTTVPVDFHHERLADLSVYSRNLSDLIHIIRNMDGILSVDTCIYHIADCFDVPAVVWFTSIDPELRVKYYPFIKGELLTGARELSTFSKSILKTGDDLTSVHHLWRKLNVTEYLDKLEELGKSRDGLRSELITSLRPDSKSE